MAMNRIQFQPGLSIATFLEQYGAESQCEQALEAARWPAGFRCPACGDPRHTTFYRDDRKHWQCVRCRRQSTVTAGTVFAATKLPLRRWFLAMYLLTQTKTNLAALELMRHLGVCYRTAWLVKHKLMEVMANRDRERVLDQRVEIDDAYLGGEKPGTRGRGSENKVPFVIAVQINPQGHPLYVRLAPIPFTQDAVATWSRQCLAASAQVVSDGLGAFRAVAGEVATHERHIVGSGRQAVEHPQFRAVNTVLGNLKTALTGTYHAFDFRKYAHRYLGEFGYRFNRRFDLTAILPRLLYAAAQAGPTPAPILRLAEVRH